MALSNPKVMETSFTFHPRGPREKVKKVTWWLLWSWICTGAKCQYELSHEFDFHQNGRKLSCILNMWKILKTPTVTLFLEFHKGREGGVCRTSMHLGIGPSLSSLLKDTRPHELASFGRLSSSVHRTMSRTWLPLCIHAYARV